MKRSGKPRPLDRSGGVESGSEPSGSGAAGGGTSADPGCVVVRDRLDALAARDLPMPVAVTVRRHLMGCVDCRRAYRDALEAAEAFRVATGPEVVPATGLAVPPIDAVYFAGLQHDVLAAVGLSTVTAGDRSAAAVPRGLVAADGMPWSGGAGAGSRLRRRLVAAAALVVGLALGGSGAFDFGAGDGAESTSSLQSPSALLTVEPQRGVRGLHGGWQEGFGFDDPSLETAPVSRRGWADVTGSGAGGGLGASAAAVELVEGGSLELDEPVGVERR